MNGKVMISLFIYFHFRYMKFIYLHCGEETNLRDLFKKVIQEMAYYSKLCFPKQI